MNYAAIKKHDIANGPGVRVSLFVSGCTHHCDGCFNPETWDFHYGTPYTVETEDELLEALAPDYIRGLSGAIAVMTLKRISWPASWGPGKSLRRGSPISTCWWTASSTERRRISPSVSGAAEISG